MTLDHAVLAGPGLGIEFLGILRGMQVLHGLGVGGQLVVLDGEVPLGGKQLRGHGRTNPLDLKPLVLFIVHLDQALVDLLVEPVHFFSIIHRHALTAPNGNPFEHLGSHDRSQTTAAQEGLLAGLDVAVAHQALPALADGDHLELVPLGIFDPVFPLIGVLAPEMVGILDLTLVIINDHVDRFIGPAMNHNGIIAGFLDLDAEACRCSRIRIEMEGGRDGTGGPLGGPGLLDALHGPRGKGQAVGRVKGSGAPG